MREQKHEPKLCVDVMGKTFEFPKETIDWAAVKSCVVTAIEKILKQGREEEIMLRHLCVVCEMNDPILMISVSRETFDATIKAHEGDDGYEDKLAALIEQIANSTVKLIQRFYEPPSLLELLFGGRVMSGLGDIFEAMQ